MSEGMRLKHLQHFRACALHDGDASQECGSDMEWHNWMLGRGRERSLSGDDLVEVWYDGTENSIAPEFGVAREWPGHSAY
ncbi:hypothetical protein GTA61_19160 [Roseobacter sp. HKCCD8831]|nr:MULTISPECIES: hypothetical protein [unclassified Roseobacter]NNV31938.1 hypothetical protein [Roseobacter sp. HKCCD9061]NNV70271.1 hypothetical protein [Roseobacter sp. HKCCD8474]NNW38421.1 hypothetical protein [Roseobacter sp. HKCCD9117-2]NNW64028.1 hypothetical protein [Roseobacter sp. HKCCD8268]NNX32222.1 hypothetical protein [Roseobacter sp. HKCCD6503]NNX53479.1 hypothetical protein [Roseobacter sp. HKCCD9024]NNY51500.1 hypothetical protein [Roseobacter sp. HKCCD8190]NNZ28056.1 hypot